METLRMSNIDFVKNWKFAEELKKTIDEKLILKPSMLKMIRFNRCKIEWDLLPSKFIRTDVRGTISLAFP